MSKLVCTDCGRVSVDKPNNDCYFCGSLNTEEL
jgi:hypothetical protein